MRFSFILSTLLTSLALSNAYADGSHTDGTSHSQPNAKATAPAKSAGHKYGHSHAAGADARTNSDVDFGSPADVRNIDRAVTFALQPAGDIKKSSLSVDEKERVRFDLSNGTSQPVAFVIGDDHVIKEYADMFKSNPDSVKGDFHGVVLAPGQTQAFAWKFNTFGATKVFAAYVGRDGSYAGRLMQIHVATISKP